MDRVLKILSVLIRRTRFVQKATRKKTAITLRPEEDVSLGPGPNLNISQKALGVLMTSDRIRMYHISAIVCVFTLSELVKAFLRLRRLWEDDRKTISDRRFPLFIYCCPPVIIVHRIRRFTVRFYCFSFRFHVGSPVYGGNVRGWIIGIFRVNDINNVRTLYFPVLFFSFRLIREQLIIWN